MPWNINDYAFKTLINRRTTSSNKAFYSEYGDETLNTHINEVWTTAIPPNPSDAVSQGVAQQYTQFALTLEPTVAGNQCYYAFSGGNRLEGWISNKYNPTAPLGTGYDVHIYDSNGNEIFPTDPCGWFFEYQMEYWFLMEAPQDLPNLF